MKKLFIFTAAASLLASCANDEILDSGNTAEREVPISFQVSQKNMTRADKLQDTGHYNFGVWAYKNTDATNAVMDNYLVGYMDATNKKGYSMDASNQTTLGDAASSANGTSMWAYEKMGTGTGQYAYSGTEGYYKALDAKYMSNKTEQWLKYWDYSSANTEFFAYAPYINGTLTPTFSNTDKKMTFSDNAIEAGFDDLSLYEYMYAYTNHIKTSYNTDVPLAFKRMNSRIQIKFYEDVDGYDVEIVDLKGNTTGATVTGVQATPSVRSGAGTTADPYTYAKSTTFWLKGKADVQFPNGTVTTTTCVVTGTSQDGNNLEFRIPEFPSTAANKNIGTTTATATSSPSIYYGLPLGTSNVTGFNFHVSYKLTATDTGETIYVNNATVYVPAASVQWLPNTSYTYVFKITKNSSGTTDQGVTPNYVDPAPNPTPSLYPIVFDGCTVEDWTEAAATEHIINQN